MTKPLPSGLLWRNEINGTPAQKIAAAVAHYIEKYGATPDTVFVHPSALPEPGACRLGVVTVKSMGTVSPSYLFVVKQKGQNGFKF